LRYVLKLLLKFPLYLGVADLSTRWRRSRKHLKWLELKNLTKPDLKESSKVLNIENKLNTRGMRHQKYRLPKGYAKRKWKEPKPLIDIFQEENWITIVAEIVGFNRETLKIHVKDQKLTLSAKAKDRRYYKSLNLPNVVIPSAVHTTFKNGVLEIRLKKAAKEELAKQRS